MTNVRIIFLFVLAVVIAIAACSDSENTLLGSEFAGDLLGSTPGSVFEDTIMVTEAGVDTFYRLIDRQDYIEVGKQQDYERTILLKADFSSAGGDTPKTVEQAKLFLNIHDKTEYVPDIRVRFHELGTEYDEGDSVAVLDTTSVIRTEEGEIERRLAHGTLSYELPSDLVEGWITGDSVHNGIAIVYAGSLNELIGMDSREGTSEGTNTPRIQVHFEDGSDTSYPITDDATYVRPTSDTDNLVVSDGLVRRMYFTVDLSQVDDVSAVHEARVVFKIVEGTIIGSFQEVVLYVPDSPDPSDPDFLDGDLVTKQTLDSGSDVLELPMTNVLLFVLSGDVEDNGFVLRFAGENTAVRQAEFYGAGDSLRASVYITYSTPAEFEE